MPGASHIPAQRVCQGVDAERDADVQTQHDQTGRGSQGYVTGIEPGTSYAYPVTIEREQKRVKQLQPGASQAVQVQFALPMAQIPSPWSAQAPTLPRRAAR